MCDEILGEVLADISGRDRGAEKAAHERLEQLTMPYWALGRLMDLAEELAGMTGSSRPRLGRKLIVVMAADHGVAAQSVSAYPQAVTQQMVANFVSGGAAINALGRIAKADLCIVDMGVAADLDAAAGAAAAGGSGAGCRRVSGTRNRGLVGAGVVDRKIGPGTKDIASEPAMTRKQAVESVLAGVELARRFGGGYDVFGVGEMGIGNTTVASTIIAALCKADAQAVTGRGTGIDDERFAHKTHIVEGCLALHRPEPNDPWDVLTKVGGFEIGGMAGLILGAASSRKPVVLDGVVSTAAGLLAAALCPAATDFMIAGHQSREPGHAVALKSLGKVPLLDLGMRLGEASGAALAMSLLDAAASLLSDVATFEEASVARRAE